MRPYVIIFSAATLDGRLASKSGYNKVGCVGELRELHRMRGMSDAVMVGANTAVLDNPQLTVRRAHGSSPLRIVVDPHLRVSPRSRAFSVPGKGVLITLEWEEERLAEHRRMGIRVIRAGRERLELERALEALYEMGVRRLLVEGGGRLNCSLLAEGLVDEVRVTIAPLVFGSGVSFAHCEEGELWVDLALRSFYELCPGWVHLAYYVLRPKKGLAGPPGFEPGTSGSEGRRSGPS